VTGQRVRVSCVLSIELFSSKKFMKFYTPAPSGIFTFLLSGYGETETSFDPSLTRRLPACLVLKNADGIGKKRFLRSKSGNKLRNAPPCPLLQQISSR